MPAPDQRLPRCTVGGEQFVCHGCAQLRKGSVVPRGVERIILPAPSTRAKPASRLAAGARTPVERLSRALAPRFVIPRASLFRPRHAILSRASSPLAFHATNRLARRLGGLRGFSGRRLGLGMRG